MPDTPTSSTPAPRAPVPPVTAPSVPASSTKVVTAPEAVKAAPGSPPKRYRLKTGLNYPDGLGGEIRSEVDDVVDDLPAESIPWLLADGHIEEE